MLIILIIGCIVLVRAGPAREEKEEYCTDPRTLRKHSAYTEWADAYSCSRHRCQPGGRNLAIYTVGCKRVEAPESAIECEEVVEDTNMQFPYCCIRLRCLVVVRGEVWTRVLGQPWETLPAAPWSHMYKMKKPPPADDSFQKPMIGPVYELLDQTDRGQNDNHKSDKQVSLRSQPDNNSPDIVIALSTDNRKSKELMRKSYPRGHGIDPERDNSDLHNYEIDEEERPYADKEMNSNESYNQEGKAEKTHKDLVIYEASAEDEEKPSSLQSLVDAIGTRMRDIENVVQRMSDQVGPDEIQRKHATDVLDDQDPRNLEDEVLGKLKGDIRGNNRLPLPGNRYLQEATTDLPAFVEDPNLHGYFSDPSNLMRRSNKKPKLRGSTYTVPIDTSRKRNMIDIDPGKYRKRTHKKKRFRKGKKKHRKDDDGRKMKISLEKIGSLEESIGL